VPQPVPPQVGEGVAADVNVKVGPDWMLPFPGKEQDGSSSKVVGSE
jgi:hypothetical protein